MRSRTLQPAIRCGTIGLALVLMCIVPACDEQPAQSHRADSAASPSPDVPSAPAQPPSQQASSAPIEAEIAPVTELQTAGNVLTSNDGVYAVKYIFDRATPPMNEPFRITVFVGAAGGPLAEEVALSVDAAMPEHGHGMNVEPTVRPLSNNSFAVDNMLFHMAGRWEIYFDITREGITSRAQDEITLE